MLRGHPLRACPGLGSDYVARLGWLDFQPGQEVRRFLAVPEGATWADMRFTAGPHEQPRWVMRWSLTKYLSCCQP